MDWLQEAQVDWVTGLWPVRAFQSPDSWSCALSLRKFMKITRLPRSFLPLPLFLLSVLLQLFLEVPRRARAGYSRSWSCLLGALGSLLGVLSSLASRVTVLASYGASGRWENAWEEEWAESCSGWRHSPPLPS